MEGVRVRPDTTHGDEHKEIGKDGQRGRESNTDGERGEKQRLNRERSSSICIVCIING